MSLKGFHIAFVTICTFLSAFFLLWGLVFSRDQPSLSLPFIIIGSVGMLLMPVYGVYFYRKASKIIL
ncbi:hypothetical protein JIN85_18215 [Luteolibacter pohnpeiensis]|uniref:Uncharacterized protein n=1 Tax=Luteolibacter pohnpeiensis TaxID=454153 RepID=A0A934SFR3_9BACT|nr:hypothetical protein [Luteolibacter pohnpeiensis]MBK1884358.1 hypothetical protein [Luteolibacter pohnpeiensis]